MNTFLGINILFDKKEIHTKMTEQLSSKTPAYICAVNANSATVANRDEIFKDAVNDAMFNICDGSLLALSYKMIYKANVKPYPGPDFFLDYLKQKKYKSFFFGSTQEILDGLKKNLTIYDSEIENMPFYSPPFLSLDEYDYQSFADMINESGSDIVWISLGAPKQEVFMYNLKPYLKKAVMVGVGAAFVFYGSEKQKRAPEIFRKLHLEWLHRTIVTRTISKRFRNQIFYMPQLLIKEFLKKGRNNG